MSQKPDWFKVDAAKTLEDGVVDQMSTLELGCAFRLLCRQWIDGYVSDDMNVLARQCRVSPAVMRKAWVTLSKWFIEIAPGKRANRFMWIDREKVVSALEKKSDAGAKAAVKRWDAERQKRNGSPMPMAMQEEIREEEIRTDQIPGITSESPFLEKEDVEPPKNSDELIEKILRLHPSNWHWRNAPNTKLEMPHSQLVAVIGAIGRHTLDEVLRGTKAYGEFIQDNPGFVWPPEKFYGAIAHYLKTKQDWERERSNGKQKSKGDDFSERAAKEREIARAFAARNRG
jgi:hypothetical protein